MKFMKSLRAFPVVALATLASSLCSCVTMDPAFFRDIGKIQDVDYPADKIAGNWLQVAYSPIPLQPGFGQESKTYLNLKPDGTGFCRHINILPPVYAEFPDVVVGPMDVMAEFEFPLTWRHSGINKWQVTYDGSRLRTISGPAGATLNLAVLAKPSVMRFHNGRLFDTAHPGTFVSMADEATLATHLREIRNTYSPTLRNQLLMKRALKQQIILAGATGTSTQTTAPAAGASTGGALSYATPVPGRQGFVYPPGTTMSPASMLDVQGFTRGQQVIDPRTGRAFLVP